MNSLKRFLWAAFVVVAVLLGLIVLMGGYQYHLTRGYGAIIDQNERVLFQYMTIRESLTDRLVNGGWSANETIVDDLEKLNAELRRLKDNRLVASELKLALVEKIDIAGLTILVKQVMADPEDVAKKKQLQQLLRTISDYLIQYDRIIVSQARGTIVSFQTVVIGALGLIISLASISLILLYKNTVSPLIRLADELAEKDEFTELSVGSRQLVVDEVRELIEAIEQLATKNRTTIIQEKSDEHEQQQVSLRLQEAVNETTNGLNGIINYAQLLYDSVDEVTDSEDRKEMLQRIITSGSEMAKTWQKLN
ncbi:hypothetical protein [Desulforhopalus singaporensis]|uniref:HAMP domain-containing protein n=1 Tax=Desulforhopalus singaporensis TaxID=91360 RepID=A0A1H0N3M5_9BACT|nr:hypothetical protein [Desulforhopalus singaporensis]SDO87288.1 hypothetical protein SAMN05660330_01232 [Desulforhopalus singaporensis]